MTDRSKLTVRLDEDHTGLIVELEPREDAQPPYTVRLDWHDTRHLWELCGCVLQAPIRPA